MPIVAIILSFLLAAFFPAIALGLIIGRIMAIKQETLLSICTLTIPTIAIALSFYFMSFAVYQEGDSQFFMSVALLVASPLTCVPAYLAGRLAGRCIRSGTTVSQQQSNKQTA